MAFRQLWVYGIFVGLCIVSPQMTATAADTSGNAASVTAKATPDADMQTLIDAYLALQSKPLQKLTPAEARVQPTLTDAMLKVLKDTGQSTAPLPVGAVSHLKVTGPKGEMTFNIYTPKGRGPFPVVVYYHGGGFVTSDTQVYDASIRGLVNAAKVMVVAPDYHLAPEYKFPSQPDEAYAAYRWVIENVQRIGGDPKKVAVAGESAGGNLAVVVSMMARDHQIPIPVHELLIYPVLDTNTQYDSYNQYANAVPLTTAMLDWYFKHYLNSKNDANNPYACPMKAASLKGMPPTTFIAAEMDPVLSEGKIFADRLQQDGVPVTYKRYDGVTHKFFGMSAVVFQAAAAQEFAAGELKKAFAAIK